MLETYSRIAILFNNEEWTTAAMGPAIEANMTRYDESRRIFLEALNLWLKSYECIAHVVFCAVNL